MYGPEGRRFAMISALPLANMFETVGGDRRKLRQHPTVKCSSMPVGLD